MSFLKKLFTSKKDEKVLTTSESIQKIKDTENLLQKKQEHLEKQLEEELAIAKQNATTNKRVALQALKRKKRLEEQLKKVDETLLTLNTQRENLENTFSNSEVLKTLEHAATSLKDSNKKMDVDNVHALMDDLTEQMDISNDISSAITSLNPSTLDDSELIDELEKLGQEKLDDEMLKVPSAEIILPDVPQDDLIKKKKKEIDPDLKQLEEWAN